MARLQPSVVPMSHDDLAPLAALWVERRGEEGHSRDAARRAVDEGRFAEAVGRDYVTVLTAVLDGALVGYVWLSALPMTAHVDVPSIGIEDVYVVPEARGQGVGRCLLTAVATHAHKRGVDHLGCAVPTQAKDANRTLARLGFAATVTRRMAQTTTLMRRLRGSEPRANLDQLLLQRRRRAQRARPTPEPVAAHS
ncbi:GNAT family N-acetyltransferase [Mobilicoccus massiliensis]|uniref:GNAT family N-acetyltransferase n=1 Tax=Mobilicoccus massiliensis TaxID=1522310 RepID=UPI0015965A1E|nr:GNAT family N-acetyltransferase [Mobilicoccus massiliensis]